MTQRQLQRLSRLLKALRLQQRVEKQNHEKLQTEVGRNLKEIETATGFMVDGNYALPELLATMSRRISSLTTRNKLLHQDVAKVAMRLRRIAKVIELIEARHLHGSREEEAQVFEAELQDLLSFRSTDSHPQV